jgi:hypothetical protein
MSVARLRALNIRTLDIQANVRYRDIMQIQDIQRLLRVGHGLVRWCDIRILHRPELIGRPFGTGVISLVSLGMRIMRIVRREIKLNKIDYF